MSDNAFKVLQEFDFPKADVRLWIFKISTTIAKYGAWYVRTDQDLENTLRSFGDDQRERVRECKPYSYIAQNNEVSCLSVDTKETNFGVLMDLVSRPEVDHVVSGIKNLRSAIGYIVKFNCDGKTIYAGRRSPLSWRAKYKKKGIINTFFVDGELSMVKGDEFTIEPQFDFYCVDDSIFITNKGGFESLMRYRAGYAQAFGELQQEQSFSDLFTDIAPLLTFVGNNSMHLRRMAVVQEKCLYEKVGFLPSVKAVSDKYEWGIVFDQNSGKISPTKETASLILKILLDQRLLSEVTKIMYDVPEGTPV